MPKHRGQRRRIAPGVYADDKGLQAEVSVGPRDARLRKGKRFDSETPLRQVQAWQEQTRTTLRQLRKLAPPRHTQGSLQREVRDYLRTLSKTECTYRRCNLMAWVAAFGDRRPETLEGTELEAQARRWEQVGIAKGTINQRKKCLRVFFTALYGEDGFNPAKGIKHRREPKEEARGVPYAWIYEVLDHLKDDMDSRCRLEVIAFTGMPHARLARLREHDFDAAAGTVYLLPRRKGQGTQGRTFPLTPEGVRALQSFFTRGCLGEFSRSALRRTWRAGWERANRARAARGEKPLPWIRPYDLRHTFGTWLYARDGDLNAVAGLLDVTIETARRYAQGAIPDRLRQAAERIGRAQADARAVTEPMVPSPQ
jgi:integrase